MADDDEIVKLQRTVVLSRFDMAAFETTERQTGGEGDLPKVGVDWQEARKFCRQEIEDGDLPTEAQWEYAARGGSRFPWSFGTDKALLENYAWYGEGLSSGKRHEVKQKLPNPLGLYDMHGNVWEWTRDWYNDYVPDVFVDPTGPNSGKCIFVKDECRVVRGGSFGAPPEPLRSVARDDVRPEGWGSGLGFRCVRVPPP